MTSSTPPVPSNTALLASLDTLVALARHLRANPAHTYTLVVANDSEWFNMSRLESLVASIRYHATAKPDAGKPALTPVAHVHCQFVGCAKSSTTLDACMLNFAPHGSKPLWFCRDHHPPRKDGAVRPVGWAPPCM